METGGENEKEKQLKMLLYLISGTDKSRHSIYLFRGKFPYAFPMLSISKENSLCSLCMVI